MLQVENHTPFAAALSVFPDADGVESAYLAVKATFELTAGEPVLAAAQLPLLPTDVYWGDSASTSLRAAGEFSLPKPATDILLTGRAIAPGNSTRVADVSIQVGPVRKVVRVFGDREWERQGDRWQPGEPAVWDRMPLRWERAFGGVVTEATTPPRVMTAELRNPVGRGLFDPDAVSGDNAPMLPNLEDPEHPIRSPEDRPPPACFAPIAPSWLPRRAHAGTYDAGWANARAPYLPRDFDARYLQLSPEDLVAPGYLRGGESVALRGFTDGGALCFDLPALDWSAVYDFDGRDFDRPLHLETVLFEPDAARFQMLWRGSLAVDKKLLRLRAVSLRCAQYGKDGRPLPPLRSAVGLPAQYAAAEISER